MKIKQLKYQGGSEDNLKLNQTKLQFEKLIEDLNTKNLIILPKFRSSS